MKDYKLAVKNLNDQFAGIVGSVKDTPGFKVHTLLFDALLREGFHYTTVAKMVAKAEISVSAAAFANAEEEITTFIKLLAKLTRETFLAFVDEFGKDAATILMENRGGIEIKFT